jgi:hypothetical protein
MGVRISWLVLARKSDLPLDGGHGFFNRKKVRFSLLAFSLLAVGDVFGRVEEILWVSSSVSDDRKTAVCDEDATIAANGSLLIFIGVALALQEFGVSLCSYARSSG